MKINDKLLEEEIKSEPRITFEGFDDTKIKEIVRAVVWAGYIVNNYIKRSLFDPKFSQKIKKSIISKAGSDISSFLDPLSEEIMKYVLLRSGYKGSIWGEEGTEANTGNMDEIATLDGLDGTENAMKMPEGRLSPYGPIAGIFKNENGILKPSKSAFYLPRQKYGFVASTESGKAYQFFVNEDYFKKLSISKNELAPFDKERDDANWIVGVWPNKPGDKLPKWVDNLYQHMSKENDGLYVLHSAGSMISAFANLCEDYNGKRPQEIGNSACVGSETIRLHDIGGATLINVLSGIIGNNKGYILGKNKEFMPDLSNIPETDIGPVVIAQNKKIYETILNIMNK